MPGPDYHWRGRSIFASVADRDEWHNKFRDYLDGVLDVVPYPDNDFQEGLALQNNVQGGLVTGPAFTWSIRVPEAENTPPDGRAAILDEGVNDLAEEAAETSSSMGQIL